MKPYTVLLLYPDYLAVDFGSDTYLAHVLAPTVEDAQRIAQVGAVEALQTDPDWASDFFVLAVFEGHLEDIKE